MTRTAFLAALEQLLAPLPEAERKDALSYYEDYLDAAGPEKEAQAIAELGTPEEVAHKILDEQAPADPSAAPASPAHKPRSTWRMVGAVGWQCWLSASFCSSIPRLPRCSRWDPLLLPRNFLLPLQMCQLRAPNRRPWIPFLPQTA